MWGNHLDSFSWRIDVKTKARHLDQLSQPTAIMEMKVKSHMEKTVSSHYCLGRRDAMLHTHTHMQAVFSHSQ